MSVLVLEPHNDDAALFCAFMAVRERAHVITVLRSAKQQAYGITAETRERESAAAMEILGLDWQQWPFPDVGPPAGLIAARLNELAGPAYAIRRVYAPAVEREGGHVHHDLVGRLAVAAFGEERVTGYLTYTRGGKSEWGARVEPQPGEVVAKLRALACYRSQIETMAAGCLPHFTRGLDEYLAPCLR